MPPAAAPTLTRRALAALTIASVLVLGGTAGAWGQEPPVTTPTSGVLVPGTTAPPTTAPATTPTTEAPADDEPGEDGLLDLDANEKVWVIVAGLVAIAVLMMILTILYWRHTKPDRPAEGERTTRAERKAAKRARKAERKEAKAKDDEPTPPSDGPLDLDELLAAPDPTRSVFAEPDQDDEPGR